MLKSALRTVIALGALLTLTGCANVAGTWTMAPDQKPGKVTIAAMTLGGDGFYMAAAKYGDKSETVTGCYKFQNGKLMLCSATGCREYPATVDGDKLMVTHEGNTITMIRMTDKNCCGGKCAACTGDKCCGTCGGDKAKCCGTGGACCKDAKKDEKKPEAKPEKK
ncbi:MAG: hypothetical protein ACKVS9_18995 [Phycisphaerae bacterium]